MTDKRRTLLGMILASCLLPGAIRAQEVNDSTTKNKAVQPVDEKRPTALVPAKPLIQIALLLDTSSSMEGLIHQAKTQLWRIVNEFVLAKRDGQRPIFEVGLYEYGNKTLGASSNFLRKVSPLTDDLDKISEELFALKIMSYGSQEYCGAVIDRATRELDWSLGTNDLKVIFIAGNESFAQGGVDYRGACKEAITRGVIVNTIFCGSQAEGLALGWKDGALRGEGAYASIDHNRIVTRAATPQDQQLASLNKALNATYVPYGALGLEGQTRQTEQDRNAQGASTSGIVQRAVTKSSAFYRNATWDLVDAVRTKRVKLNALKSASLPEDMRKMSLKERKSYLDSKAKERERIQQLILGVNQKRQIFIADLKAKDKSVEEKTATLDGAVIKTLRKQAARKKFEIK